MDKIFEYHFRNVFPSYVQDIEIAIPFVTKEAGPYQIMVQTGVNQAAWTFHTDDTTRLALTKGNVPFDTTVRLVVLKPNGDFLIRDYHPLELSFDISKAFFSVNKLIDIARLNNILK